VTSALSQLREELERVGWTFRDDIAISELDGLFSCSYAALGVLVTPSMEEAVRRWTACQGEMASLRGEVAIGSERDLYLLILIPELASDAMNYLPAIINDTHVCRKLVLELRGRRIREALDDIPLVAMKDAAEAGTVSDKMPGSSNTLPLPEILLVDLAKRSPSKVLELMLDGTYGETSSDAP